MTETKRPGRPKGARNKRSDKQVQAIKNSGLTPLEYLAGIYQDDEMPITMRLDAAKAAAPYVHARLSSVEMDINPGDKRSMSEYSAEELAELVNSSKAA